jgi:farnesyl-diphosphate farnesyltransferase
LQRYCYFVAGAIGHLLTEAFVFEVSDLEPARARVLRSEAERFGIGLQLVNILRDIVSDLERDCCFVPRTTLQVAGLVPRDLVERSKERRAREALLPLFDMAQENLDAAFEYALAIPPAQAEIRNFCLVPLWLAVATLALCRTDARLLDTSARVKLERAEVQRLVTRVIALSKDDEALRKEYITLTGAQPSQVPWRSEASAL